MEEIMNFIRNVGEVVVPILTVILSSTFFGYLVSSLISNKIRKRNDKESLDLLKGILQKDTGVEEITKMQNSLSEFLAKVESLKDSDITLQNQVILLAQMINVIFENSTLPSEVKAQLNAIKTKLEYGVNTNVVDDLSSEIVKLKEENDVLKNEIETTKNVVKTEPTTTKKYKKTVIQ